MLTFRKWRFHRRLVTVASRVAPLRHCLIVILATIAHNLLRDIPKFSPSITKLCPDHSLPPLSAAHLHPNKSSSALRWHSRWLASHAQPHKEWPEGNCHAKVGEALQQGRTMGVTCQREERTDGFILQ